MKEHIPGKILIYVIFGLTPTVLLLKYHEYICLNQCDMNPLCFSLCCIPAVMGLGIFGV